MLYKQNPSPPLLAKQLHAAKVRIKGWLSRAVNGSAFRYKLLLRPTTFDKNFANQFSHYQPRRPAVERRAWGLQ